MVTVASSGEETQDERTKAAFFIVEPDQTQLTEIAHLLDRGVLKTFVDGLLPLAQAPAAYSGTIERRHRRGKVVIQAADEAS